MLQYGGDALQPHAGIDRGLGQRMQRAFVVAIELHEHEVPDFDVAVAIGIRRAGRATGNFCPVIEKNLAARATRAGVGHLPEVIRTAAGFVADAHDALNRHTDLLAPDIKRFVVGLIYRDPQFVFRQLVNAREQLPREMNRVLFEIIAETEVTQHLEKRVMARGIADVFQIVMFAACAHAALRGGGAHVIAFVLPKKNILELHHAGVGEQQRRIVARYQRRGGDYGVAFASEIVEEFCAYLVAFHVQPLGFQNTGARQESRQAPTPAWWRESARARHRGS